MKRPVWPYQAILQRCARRYSSAPSSTSDAGQPWPQLRRRARTSSPSSEQDDSHGIASSQAGFGQWLGELGRSSGDRRTWDSDLDVTRVEGNDRLRLDQTASGSHTYGSMKNRRGDQIPPGMDYDGDIELRYFTPRNSSSNEGRGGMTDEFPGSPRHQRQPSRTQPGDHDGKRGPELWFRHRALPEQGWQRVNGNWTLQQTPRGPELMRMGTPNPTGRSGARASDQASDLAAAESPSLKAGAEKRMITVSGLSKNLTDRDFHRISSQSLTGWDDAITRVQQERDPLTFEPLGVYKLSFATGIAATSYLHDLSCRHRIAKARAGAQFGLWENTMSRYLRKRHELEEEGAREREEFEKGRALGVSPGEDATVGPDAFTLAPPTVKSLHTKRSRIAVKGWQKALGAIVEGLGYGPQASVVLMDMYPPEITTQALEDFIRNDEQARGVSWRTSKAVSLQSIDARSKALRSNQERGRAASAESGGGDWPEAEGSLWTSHRDEVRNGRFVFAFPSDTHAARFQRSWHQRTLTASAPNGEESQYTASVQVVRW